MISEQEFLWYSAERLFTRHALTPSVCASALNTGFWELKISYFKVCPNVLEFPLEQVLPILLATPKEWNRKTRGISLRHLPTKRIT